MRIALMAGTTNVVRFPVEQRAKPSLDLLRDIAPDLREISLVAEAFGLDEPSGGIRDVADRKMAERIASGEWPAASEERAAALDAILKPLVERAVVVCRTAHKAAAVSDDAAEAFVNAQGRGGYWLSPLEDASNRRATEAAEFLIDAYVATQEAFGAARAIRMAKCGEEWRPFDVEAAANELFFGAGAPSAGAR
jgi:hypothetical protein